MLLRLSLSLAALSLAYVPAAAQQYPDRPIRVIVGFAAGSASDVVPRLILEKAAPLLKTSFIFENQPGAGGDSALLAVAKAEPDGYRIGATAGGPLSINKWLRKNLGYDPETDIEPITTTAFLPNVVAVTNKFPAQTLKELAAYAKANPDKITYSSVGPGSAQHIAGVQFESIVGTTMRHLPYRVTGQLVTDLITGEVPLSFQNIPNVGEQFRGNQLRILAIAAKSRHPSLPNVPTTAEAGMPGLLSSAWFALVAPKGTSKPIVDKLNQAIVQAMKDPDIVRKLNAIGAEAAPMSPEQFRAFISSEMKSSRELAQKAGLKPG